MKEKRIGKFVTRQHVPFTDAEIADIVSSIKRQFEGNAYGIRYHSHRTDGEDGLFALRIVMAMPTLEGRDAEGARLRMRGIYFVLYKAKGEIEVDFRRNMYDPFDGVCYSGDIHFNADWCRYRCRTWESYQKVCPYRYGDEISDLDYSGVLRRLWHDLSGCRPCAMSKAA